MKTTGILLLLVTGTFFLLHTNNTVLVEASCLLCDNRMPTRLDCIIENDIGMTCGDLFAKLLLREEDSVCELSKNKYQQTCCGSRGGSGDGSIRIRGEGGDEDDLCYTGPTAAPVYDGEKGDEPVCHICGTEEYPGKAQHLFTTRYVP